MTGHKSSTIILKLLQIMYLNQTNKMHPMKKYGCIGGREQFCH